MSIAEWRCILFVYYNFFRLYFFPLSPRIGCRRWFNIATFKRETHRGREGRGKTHTQTHIYNATRQTMWSCLGRKSKLLDTDWAKLPCSILFFFSSCQLRSGLADWVNSFFFLSFFLANGTSRQFLFLHFRRKEREWEKWKHLYKDEFPHMLSGFSPYFMYHYYYHRIISLTWSWSAGNQATLFLLLRFKAGVLDSKKNVDEILFSSSGQLPCSRQCARLWIDYAFLVAWMAAE